jgi:hypothetical protein
VELQLHSPIHLHGVVLRLKTKHRDFKLSETNFNIIIPLFSGLPCGLFLGGFPTKFLYAFLIYLMRIYTAANLSLLHLITLISSGEEYRKLYFSSAFLLQHVQVQISSSVNRWLHY